jgi:hypothetical protein
MLGNHPTPLSGSRFPNQSGGFKKQDFGNLSFRRRKAFNVANGSSCLTSFQLIVVFGLVEIFKEKLIFPGLIDL